MKSCSTLYSLKTALLALAFSIVGAGKANAQTIVVATPTPVPAGFVPQFWPEEFFQSTLTRAEEVQYRLVNALFESATNAQLFDTSADDARARLSVKREIFNNYDLLNTWTVIDHLQFKVDGQLMGLGSDNSDYTAPINTLTFPFGGLKFGVNGTVELADMRQVNPQDLRTHHEEDSTARADDIQELNPYLDSSPLDTTFRVKIHDILNPIKLPFKIPFSKSDVLRMKDGEIISYNLTGQATFGGSIGWNIVPSDTVNAGIALKMETHLDGEFQVSVLRENERFVKVRVSKVRGTGRSGSIGASVDLKEIYKGFFLFKDTPLQLQIGRISTTLVPFNFSIDRSRDHEIDIGYRYDLSTETGKDAYHRAVLGSFIASETLANESAGEASPSVSKIFTRTSTHLAQGRHSTIDLNILFKTDHNRTTDQLSTEITLPDGTKHIFRNIEERNDSSNNLFGDSEKSSHKMTVILNKEGFVNQTPGSILLTSENVIEDASTNGKDLNEYVTEVETVLGEPTLFPNFPIQIPGTNPNHPKKAYYGRSSFYYGFTLVEKGLEAFLHTDFSVIKAKAEALRVRFNEQTFSEAKGAYDARNPELTYQKLSELFSDRRHLLLLSNLITEVLDPSQYEKFLVAQNTSFGSIQNRGHHILPVESDLQNTEQQMGLGSDTFRTVADPEAYITGLSTRVDANHKVKLHFILSKEPNFIYFRLTPIAHANRKDAVELIILNRNHRFKAGANEITLDADSQDELEHKLSAKFTANELLTLSMGFSAQDSNWGYGSSTDFRTTENYRRSTPTP